MATRPSRLASCFALTSLPLGHLYRLDTGQEHPLFRIRHHGGPSPQARMGYLEHTISLVPAVGRPLAGTDYRAEIRGRDGQMGTHRMLVEGM